MKTTMFSWGYFGWGNHTRELVAAVDDVEKSRGFRPPIFVDIRISRSVRAAGFTGTNFEKLLGPQRHRWMKSLGNRRILSGEGAAIQIADPAAAKELLRLGREVEQERRRVIFFCGCKTPRCEGEVSCHRATVAELVIQAATAAAENVRVVEWPGDGPRRIRLELSEDDFHAVSRGRKSIPLRDDQVSVDLMGLPLGSVTTLCSNGARLHRLVGPAVRSPGQWFLPVQLALDDPQADAGEYEKRAVQLRRDFGFEEAKT